MIEEESLNRPKTWRGSNLLTEHMFERSECIKLVHAGVPGKPGVPETEEEMGPMGAGPGGMTLYVSRIRMLTSRRSRRAALVPANCTRM